MEAAAPAGRAPLALVMLAVAAALGSAVGTTAGTFMVDTVMSDGMSAGAAGALLIVGSVTSLVVRIVIGLRADRMERGHLLRVAALLAAGAPGFLLLAVGSGPALVLGAMLAFGGGWGWAGLLNYCRRAPQSRRRRDGGGCRVSGRVLRRRLGAADLRPRRRALVLRRRLVAVQRARARRRRHRPGCTVASGAPITYRQW